MEELDLLKKDWKKQEVHQPKLSYDDIDKMMVKKSSSLVKWVFYVSLLELGFGIAIVILALFIQPDILDDSSMPSWLNWFFYACSAAVFYFIYKFCQFTSIKLVTSHQTSCPERLSSGKAVDSQNASPYHKMKILSPCNCLKNI